MACIIDLSMSSDSEDDVDYVPDGVVSDCSMEEENVSDEEDFNAGPSKGKTTTKKGKDKEAEKKVESPAKDDLKQRANDLWASFLNDVESETSKKNTHLSLYDFSTGFQKGSGVKIPSTSTKPVNEVFEFAGETVTLNEDLNPFKDFLSGGKAVVEPFTEEEIKSFDALAEKIASEKSSLEPALAKNIDSENGNPHLELTQRIDAIKGSLMPILTPNITTGKSNLATVSVLPEKPTCMPKKRGIDSVLGAIMNKKKKLTVLEKTSIDWKIFKKDEGLEEDLEKFNKGKQGFIERQRFLERSDLRSFEVEKSLRQTMRKK